MPKRIADEKRSLNGYMPSPPDDRDYTFDKMCMKTICDEQPLPEEYRTEGHIPVLNQGANSDCVAHAIAVATAYGQYKVQQKFNDFSRGYIYGNRKAGDYQGEGMYIRQALKNFNHDGDCLTPVFPYRGTYPAVKAKIAERPEEYLDAANKNKLIAYCRLYTEREIKMAIMLQGSVVVGITTYKNCMGKNIKVPTADDEKSGGHAMCCVGWNEDGWIIQNSWGKYFGDGGFCYLPYDYPVDEWWGLTADIVAPQPKKDNFFRRVAGWFKMVWQNIKNFFHK